MVWEHQQEFASGLAEFRNGPILVRNGANAMNTRVRRSPEAIAAELRRKATAAEKKVKNLRRASETRRSIIAGFVLKTMAESGDRDAERAWERMLAGLKRPQDRVAFGLEPLPEVKPSDQPGEQPPLPDYMLVADRRLSAAVVAWKTSQAPVVKDELVGAIIQWEDLTGKPWPHLKDRASFGFSDQPGKLLVRAS